ncbi:uncharacterized protein LOC113313244 [Papaver somniferum]|uniref:uncharacterized protein LOC113313244 n=1 Tax=Papaver somniferum TaxID=3469 RepID=UPI000E7017A3|nr:uncharacterized protein LOC113313244 [Papaver somniferum]
MAEWGGSVKIDAVPMFRQLQKRFQLVPDDYRLQIYNRRERVDQAVFRTKGPSPASSYFLVELYPRNLFLDFTSHGPNVDFRLDNEELNRALSEVTKREAHGPERPIYIFLQYQKPKMSFLKMVANDTDCPHCTPTDKQPVLDYYEAALADMPNRFLELNEIETMYHCLKEAENCCKVAQVVFRDDQCEVAFGPG